MNPSNSADQKNNPSRANETGVFVQKTYEVIMPQTQPKAMQSPQTIDAAQRNDVVNFLVSLGLPALPVAPTQVPYPEGRHKISKGDGKRNWPHCPTTKDLKPEPLFTGKNPSFLDRAGDPQLVNHSSFQDKLPDEGHYKMWFGNSLNGVGTLGGWGDIIWLDFDVKQFDSQDE